MKCLVMTDIKNGFDGKKYQAKRGETVDWPEAACHHFRVVLQPLEEPKVPRKKKRRMAITKAAEQAIEE